MTLLYELPGSSQDGEQPKASAEALRGLVAQAGRQFEAAGAQFWHEPPEFPEDEFEDDTFQSEKMFDPVRILSLELEPKKIIEADQIGQETGHYVAPISRAVLQSIKDFETWQDGEVVFEPGETIRDESGAVLGGLEPVLRIDLRKAVKEDNQQQTLHSKSYEIVAVSPSQARGISHETTILPDSAMTFAEAGKQESDSQVRRAASAAAERPADDNDVILADELSALGELVARSISVAGEQDFRQAS